MFIAGERVDGESGERTGATSPATRESLGTVPEGTRGDAQRAIRRRTPPGGGGQAVSAFERAEAMERIAVVAERRDDLARTLTLDQAQAAQGGGVRRGRRARAVLAHGRGRRAPARGRDAAVRGRGKAVLVYRVPKGVAGDHSVELAVHDAGGGDCARARGGKRGRLGAGAHHVGGSGQARGMHLGSGAAGIFNMVTGTGRGASETRSRAMSDTHAIGFVGSITTGYKVAERAAGKSLLLEMGGNGPVVVLEDADWTRRSPPRSSPPSSARARAAPPASASSSTSPCTTRTSTSSRPRWPRRSGSATPSRTTRRWAH